MHRRSMGIALAVFLLPRLLHAVPDPRLFGEAMVSAQPAEAATPAAPAEAAPAEEKPGDLIDSTLALDLSTASFYELSDWLRSLGLSDSGGMAELRARLFDHYGIKDEGKAAAEGRRVVIESADKVEYGKGAGKGVVRLSGGVRLTIAEKGGTTYSIEAREVVYDRDRNAVSAQGRVVYTRSAAGRLEVFKGGSLAADLDDWSGLFLDGIWRRDNATIGEGDRGLVFSAGTLRKSSGDFSTLDGAIISPSDSDSPNFSIRAGRLWFLGGNDWAVSNALLYVGEVPLLYLPFFYYPSEEIVFHPVFGYREREGNFLQTTTYLAGQKPPSTTGSTILKLAPETGPTEPRGLFLKRVTDRGGAADPGDGSAKTQAQPSASTVKLMADTYVNLGYFLGLDASLPASGPLSKLALSSGLGLSRSVFYVNGQYGPYSTYSGGQSVWNHSHLLGSDLPLRYGLSLSTGLSLGSLRASLDFPLYSDPWFDADFRNRSEDMDWLKLSKKADTSVTATPVKKTSFAQKLALSWSLKPGILSPWISNINLSRLSASLSWISKSDELLRSQLNGAYAAGDALWNVDPARDFFGPETLRPLDLALDLSGSLLDYPQAAKAPASKADAAAGPLPLLRAPWDEGAEADKKGADKPEQKDVLPSFPPPALATDPAQPAAATPFATKLAWGFQPAAFLERRFTAPKGAADTGLGSTLDSVYDLASWKLGATLNSTSSLYSSLLSGSAGLGWAYQEQRRALNNQSQAASLNRIDAQYLSNKLTGNLRLSSKPFPASGPFGASSLSWSLDSLIYQKAFASYDPATDTATYKESGLLYSPDFWKPEIITTHSLAATLALSALGIQQSLGLAVNLPPLSESWNANFSISATILGATLALTAQERASKASDTASRVWSPATFGLRAALPFGLSASDNLSYDFGKAMDLGVPYPVSNALSLSWAWFTASLQSARSKGYIPVKGVGWTADGSEDFRLSSLSLSLSPKIEAPASALWRPTASLGLSYTQSLLKFSDSTLSLAFTAGMVMGRGFTLSFSSQSQNRSVWRYWPSAFLSDAQIAALGIVAKNPFVDIIQSLSFWDSASRAEGFFKVKNLSFRLAQDLEDWTLAIEAQAVPKLDTTLRQYYIDPSFTFTVAWKDISEIKTALKYQNKLLSW